MHKWLLHNRRIGKMERSELETKKYEIELLLANETQISYDEKPRILLKLLDFIEEELGIGDD